MQMLVLSQVMFVYLVQSAESQSRNFASRSFCRMMSLPISIAGASSKLLHAHQIFTHVPHLVVKCVLSWKKARTHGCADVQGAAKAHACDVGHSRTTKAFPARCML